MASSTTPRNSWKATQLKHRLGHEMVRKEPWVLDKFSNSKLRSLTCRNEIVELRMQKDENRAFHCVQQVPVTLQFLIEPLQETKSPCELIQVAAC